MAYYDKMSKKPLTRREHIKKDAAEWKKDEGSAYRGGKSKSASFGKTYTVKSASGSGKTGTPGGRPPRPAAKDGVRQDGSRSRGRQTAAGPFSPAGEKRGPAARPAFSRPAQAPSGERSGYEPVRSRSSSPAPERRYDTDFRPSEPENLISGRNPIREALKTGRDIEKLLVAKGDLNGTAREIVAMAREQHIPVQTVERAHLDEICRGHQGMVAYASAYRYYEVEDMLADAEQRGEKPFLIILDKVTDPQNLGAIIRTAACAGAHGVIVPQRRAVGLTPSAVKASAGAIERIKVARVTNLTRTLDFLKQQGVWIYAADLNGTDYRQVDFSGAVGLVIGSEGEGISTLVASKCDFHVTLPMSNAAVNSLNASVAAGILMYAVMACR